jgi:hypothetical protein
VIFKNLRSRRGGAIYFDASSEVITISCCSFVRCVARETGGGCYLNCITSSLSHCSGTDCSSGSFGLFIHIVGVGDHSFDFVDLESCFETFMGISCGVLCLNGSMDVKVNQLNVTNCHTSRTVCISSESSGIVALISRFSTFATNSGRFGLYGPKSEGVRGWSFHSCDFLNNSVSIAFLYTDVYGMIVVNCHFSQRSVDIGFSTI